MKRPKKNTERLLQTIIRTIITSIIIALILTFAHVFPGYGMSKLQLFGTIWLMIFCIVFLGHLLEVVFINYIKFMLPANLFLLYIARLSYWFLTAIPLFMLAAWVGDSISSQHMRLGDWWVSGVIYVGIELFMHAIMQMRRKRSFYNGVY